MTKIIRYALLNKNINELVGFYTTANPEDAECESVSFTLESRSHNGRIWNVDTRELAEYVCKNSTKWYNADYNHPSHSFNNLEVIEFTIEL